jgi:hypothetical protein
VTHTHKKRFPIETVFEEAQMLDLADRHFIAAIISTLKELKLTLLKEVKERPGIVVHSYNPITTEAEAGGS